jgi:hypothetical protein
MEPSSTDIVNAYAYHKMLDRLAHNVSDCEDSEESSSSDDDDIILIKKNLRSMTILRMRVKTPRRLERTGIKNGEDEQPGFPLYLQNPEHELTFPSLDDTLRMRMIVPIPKFVRTCG